MPLENLKKYDIVLASNSPRRRELLGGLGLPFRVEVLRGIKEDYPADTPIEKIAEEISKVKANAYKVEGNEMLITADTVVILNDEVIGKPRDNDDAKLMLAKLSGHTHIVITGVTITIATRSESFSVTSKVTFASLTSQEIEYYVDNFHPLDKAGAYGIQEWIGYVAVKGIEGSFYNVMGLPVQHLYTVLKTF